MKRFIIAFALLAFTASGALAVPPATRDFEFTYSFIIKDIPKGSKEVAFWVPIPQSTDYQKISYIDIDTDANFSIGTEPVYNNKMLYAKVITEGAATIPVTISYKVHRKEKDALAGASGGAKEQALDIYLKPSRLVTISDRIKDISMGLTEGKSAVIDKARAIYEYVYNKMAYDKSGTGWGRGDTEYACDASKGNCTDFHSLFISLARAAGIPARFKIGFPIAADKSAGEVGGYHCWAEFYDKTAGWVPVDISAAKQDGTLVKKEYFFGRVCENRVELAAGRDITLIPPQSGEKLNFFIYPYIEVDGFAHSIVDKDFAFKNL